MAEDDVPFLATVMLAFHVVWVCLLVGWLVDQETIGPECIRAGVYLVAVYGLLGSMAAAAALEACMIAVGTRGTMFERSKRHALPTLIYASVAVHLVIIGFNAYCTYLMYHSRLICPAEEGKEWNATAVLWWLIYTNWTAFTILAIQALVLYNLFPDYTRSEAWRREYMCLAWTFCCCCCCCCCWGMTRRQERQRQRSWAERFGTFMAALYGHMDLAPSDLVVAFWLAMTLQRAKRRKAEAGATAGLAVEATAAMAAPPPAVVERGPAVDDGDLCRMERAENSSAQGAPAAPPAPLVDAAVLQEGAHFCQYAFAAYGWMLYAYAEGAMGLAELCCSAPGCAGRLSWRDALCGLASGRRLSREAVASLLPCTDDEVLFMRMENEGEDVLPYIIAADTATKSVVLSIRGALTLEDNIRDLLLDPVAELGDWLAAGAAWEAAPPAVRAAGDDSRCTAHFGYLETACATLADVQRAGVLQGALVGPTARYSGYRLVVTGHSLGAGCAFLIALRLRQLVPNLKCWCFSPPGGLASAATSLGSMEWCTTVVCGHEWAPRLTVTALDAVRDEMMEAAARCHSPKASIVSGWMRGRRWREEELFYPPGQYSEEVLQTMRQYHADLAADPHRQRLLRLAGDYLTPGRIVYMRKVATRPAAGCCGGEAERVYAAEWIHASELLADGLVLSGRMNSDHMPNHHLKVLRRLADDAKGRLSTSGTGGGTDAAITIEQGAAC